MPDEMVGEYTHPASEVYRTPMPDDDTQLLEALRAASADLLYPSESDEPFTAFIWKATETDPLKQIAIQGNEIAPVEDISLDDFFAQLTAGETSESFARLRQAIQSHLTGIRVFRIGQIEVQVYLIGRSPAGDWAGLRTMSVET